MRCLHSGPGPATGDMVPHTAPLTLTMVTLILVTPHPASCSHEDEAAEDTTADSLTLTHEWKGKQLQLSMLHRTSVDKLKVNIFYIIFEKNVILLLFVSVCFHNLQGGWVAKLQVSITYFVCC